MTSEIQGATHPASHGLRSTLAGIIVNLCLAAIKGIAGVAGQSYALIADAIESLTDVFSSLIVYVGLRVACARPMRIIHTDMARPSPWLPLECL